jgi:phage terminase large subunit-like protein
VQANKLVARRAERVSSPDAFALRPDELDALRTQPWWRDEYQPFASSIALLSRLVLEDDRTWGQIAEDLQWEDALAILNPASVTPFHFLTRARGRSKTTDLAAIVLVVMLTQSRPGDRLYALAADQAQGTLLVDSIRGFISRTPGLAHVARVNRYTVVTPGDVQFEALAADAAGAWGLRPAFLVIDEIAWWAETPTTQKLWEATYTAMHKVPGSRLVVLTTAGDPAHFSYQLRERADASPLWRLHEVPGPPPWADQARLDEERATLTDSAWRRLFLNQWTTGNDRLTNLDEVTACLRDDPEPLSPRTRTRYVIGVDLGLVHDPTVAVVAHLQPDNHREAGGLPTVVVDHIRVWPGTHEAPVDLDVVERWVHDAAHHYHRAHVVMDNWQGAGMAQRLRNQHLKVTDITFTADFNDHLARTMIPLLRGRRLSLPHDTALVDELVNLRILEPRPGKYRIEHDANHHNDRAIAIALAAQDLLNTPPRRKVELIV